MTTHNAHGHAQGPNGHDAEYSGIDIVRLLRASGYGQKTGWFQLEPGDGHEKEEPTGDESVSEAAIKKRIQRAEDRANGWTQCNVKAPLDDDAQKLMSCIGIGIKEPDFREVMWIAVRNPEAVRLGAKVHGLRGIRKFIARLIIGQTETRTKL